MTVASSPTTAAADSAKRCGSTLGPAGPPASAAAAPRATGQGMKLSSQVFSTLLMSAERMLDLILCSRSLPGTRESMGGARATRRAAAAAEHGDEAPEGRKGQQRSGIVNVLLSAFLRRKGGIGVSGQLMRKIFENDRKTKFSRKIK